MSGQAKFDFSREIKPEVQLTVPAPAPDPMPSMNSDKHDSFSDEYLRGKVTEFIFTKDSLKNVVPWQDIDDSGSGIKRELLAWSYAVKDKRRIPPGILLHGDQGTGKTSIVKSFAAKQGLKMFRIDGSIHGALRGQSEKLIKYVFDAIREEAATKACILLLPNVDSSLSGTDVSISPLDSKIKQHWDDLIKDDIPCFVFGVTNKPWLLNMVRFRRHFELKAHVKKPQMDVRYRIVKNVKAEYWNTISDEECESIAAAMEGFSPYDIQRAFERKFVHLLLDMHEAKRWIKLQHGDRQVWVPASLEDAQTPVVKVDPDDCEPRPITAAMMFKFIADGQAAKTGTKQQEDRHSAWNAEHR